MRRALRVLTPFVLLWVGGPGFLKAQGTQTASASGQVLGPGERPLSGAAVRLSSPSLQGVRVLATDEAGRFTARLLPPGSYRIEVSRQGYQTQVVQQRIGLEQTLTPLFRLAPEATGVVEVAATSAAADKAKLETSSNYTYTEMERLPVSRTRVEEVVLLSPGVTQGVHAPQVRGSQSSGNLYLVDGVNYADNVFGSPRINLLFDALEETQILTGAISAEYGDVDGGVVNSLTKSGGNDFTAQCRLDLSDPSWSARYPHASQKPSRELGQEWSLSVGGPLTRDRLWFHLSSFRREVSPTRTLSPGAARGIGPTTYAERVRDRRHNLKLTWALGDNHTLVGSFFKQDKREIHDYGAAEVVALNERAEASRILSLQLRSMLSQDWVLSARLGIKRWEITLGGAREEGPPPLLNTDDDLIYGNAIFDGRQPTRRDMDTFSLKLSHFFSLGGAHELDLGLDSYRGKVQGNGAQSQVYRFFSGANRQVWIQLRDLDLEAQTAVPGELITWDSVDGAKARVFTEALYLNDRWTLDTHWSFQAGLRLDRFRGRDERGRETTSGHGLAPRLGVKLDPSGAGRWVFGLSFCRYNQRPLDVVLNAVTYADIPKEVHYAPVVGFGPAPQPLSALLDLANYDPDHVTVYNDAVLNLRLDPNLRPQRVREIQASATRTLQLGQTRGYLRATFVYKVWKDLIDVRYGQDGQVEDPLGTPYYVRMTFNNPLARRLYRGLELDGQVGNDRLSCGGNLTWSRLEGNYRGEEENLSGAGSKLSTFSITDGRQLFDPALVEPDGRLDTDRTWKLNLNATYNLDWRLGRSTVALMYRFESGARANEIRTLDAAQLSPSLPAQFGSEWTQFRNNRRGTITYPSLQFLDLALNHEVNLLRSAGRSVQGFGRLMVQNLLNHQQRTKFNVSYENPTLAGDPWVPGPDYGQAASPSYWATPRTFTVSLGVRY